jgi:hypothetical protein
MITFRVLPRQISIQNPANSFTPILLQTLCRRQNTQPLWNQANPDSFSKTPGGGYLGYLGDTSAHSASLRYHFPYPDFSTTYKSLPANPPKSPFVFIHLQVALATHSIPITFIFMDLQIAFSATPFVSNQYKLPGVAPPAKPARFKMGIQKRCRRLGMK